MNLTAFASIPYLGEIASLMTALIWAIAVILFKKSGEHVHPIALNLFKNSLAATLIIPTLFLFNVSLVQDVPISDYLILILSGAIGIGIADTLFFKSLNLLGATLSAIVSCVYIPIVFILSMIMLSEKMTLIQYMGTALIVLAVIKVTLLYKIESHSRHDIIWGVVWGVLALIGMALGIIIAKPILNRSPLLWVTEIRFIGGLSMLLVLLFTNRNRKKIFSSLFATKSWGYVGSGSFIGAYLALIVWLIGMKYTTVSISAVLNQMSQIFIFILAAIFLKEPFDKDRIFSTVIAFIGALLIILG